MHSASKSDVALRSVLLRGFLYDIFPLLVILRLYWSFICRNLSYVVELLFPVKKSNLILIWFGPRKVSRFSLNILRLVLPLLNLHSDESRQLFRDSAAFCIIILWDYLILVYRIELLLGLVVKCPWWDATLTVLVNLWESFSIQNQHPGLYNWILKLGVRIDETECLFILNHFWVRSIFLCFLD